MSVIVTQKLKGGLDTRQQAKFVLSANADKVMDNILVPGKVIASDISAGPVLVGQGNILRIRVTAATYIAFGSAPDAAPMNAAVTSSISPAIELFTAGVYLVVATADFIRASANPARLEQIIG